MRLQLCTWPEVETYLETNRGIIVPIGSTEQHGPIGFIGTDALTAEMIAFAVGDAVEAMVAPTINVGMAQHHLGFPGSITLRPTTLIAVIRDMVNSLAHHGFDRFFLINGHGGNIATVTAAFGEIYTEISLATAAAKRSSLRCRLCNWYQNAAVDEVSKTHFGDSEGSHATPSEVALTYFGYPEDGKRVHRDRLTPEVAPKGTIYDADDYRRQFPDGRIGSNPGLATAEIGKQVYDAAVADVIGQYRDFMAA